MKETSSFEANHNYAWIDRYISRIWVDLRLYRYV